MFEPAIIRGAPSVETRLLLEYLQGAVGRDGVYVDVGANDPVQGSQSQMLDQLGWKGLCVEPQPRYAEALRRERDVVVVQKACGAPGCTGRKLTLSVRGITAVLDPARIYTKYDAEDVYEVEMDTLSNILDEHGFHRIDYLSIDVDGFEPEVLSGFDIRRFRPRLVLVEDVLFHFRTHRALTSAGYRWVRRTGWNNWYVPAEEHFPVSAYGHLQMFRKAYLGMPIRLAKRRINLLLGK